ncbi:MAG: glycosyltransferase [Cyclobacteriaceae bacterium]
MKNILVLVFSNLKNDARVTRQVQWLKKKHKVTVICFDSDELPDVTVVRINQTKLSLLRKALLSAALVLRQYSLAYKIFHSYEKVVKPLNVPSYDLVLANDIDTLPLAFRLKARKILFDAHEYAPRHFENNKIWKTFFQPFYLQLCKKYIPRVDAMLTVGKGLADEYAKNFGVKPTIITNATRYFDLQPSSVDPGRIRLVHHGIANESRRLELMIEMMAHLKERFSLDLFLLTSDYASRKTRDYIKAFTQKAEENPRIKIFPPVKSTQVVNTINKYDLGVFLIPPINFNYANTLPNKLFDFIQARLGIAIGPTPEMASIVNTYGNGVVAEDFEPESLARKLNQLTTEDIVRFKNQSSFAAKQLNAEKNEIVFTNLTDRLLLS